MGKTFSTGLLTNGIWQDSSNNIGIGAAANASFKLQVTGTTNLTGALSGTSASFSGNVNVGTNIAQLLPISAENYQLLVGNYYDGTNLIATATSGSRTVYNVGGMDFRTFTGATVGSSVTDTSRLTIASTGAATFSTNSNSTITNVFQNTNTTDTNSRNYFNVVAGNVTTSIQSIHNDHSYINVTNNLYFQSGGSVKMTMLSNGRFGIGTTAPADKLHVSNGGAEGLEVGFNTNQVTMIAYNRSTSAYIPLILQGGGGNVLIGTTTDRGYRFLANSNSATGAIEIRQNNAAADIPLTITNEASSGTRSMITFQSGGYGVSGTITSGNTTTSYNTSSDYRLKDDLKEIKGLEKLCAIKVYDFKWKADDSRMDGVLAHELAEVLPYAVNGEKDGEQMQGVDYSKLVPILVKAIQEQQAQIEELKAKIK